MKIKLMPLLIAVMLAAVSCGQKKQDERKTKVEDANTQIDKQAGVFDPAALQSNGNSHYAIDVTFNSANFALVPNTFSVRPGKFATGASDAMPFKVNFTDSVGKLLGSYAIEDPRVLRSCDSNGTPHTKILTTGKFTLLIPANKAIRTIQIAAGNQERFQLPVNFTALTDTIGIKR